MIAVWGISVFVFTISQCVILIEVCVVPSSDYWVQSMTMRSIVLYDDAIVCIRISWQTFTVDLKSVLSRNMIFSTLWYVRLARCQISLRIRAV